MRALFNASVVSPVYVRILSAAGKPLQPAMPDKGRKQTACQMQHPYRTAPFAHAGVGVSHARECNISAIYKRFGLPCSIMHD